MAFRDEVPMIRGRADSVRWPIVLACAPFDINRYRSTGLPNDKHIDRFLIAERAGCIDA